MIHLSSLLESRALALGFPFTVCAILLLRGGARGFNRTLLTAFAGGTLESVLLSSWQSTPDELSLHVFSACALLFVMMPRSLRPNWKLGYCLIFASELATDLTCTALYGAREGCLSPTFFCGVGGAGVFDALLLIPLWGAATLAAISWLETRAWAHRSLLPRPTIVLLS